MRTLLFLAFAAITAAQDVTTVATAEQLALTTNTVAVTITATQGDGTVCTLSKSAGNAIGLTLRCVTAQAAGPGFTYTSTLRGSGAAIALPFGLGDVLCLVGINPTGAPVTLGSLGPIPATGAAWSCTSNIRTAGTVTGQTAPTAGSVSWP